MKWGWDLAFLCIMIGTIINGIVLFNESIFNIILALILIIVLWVIYRVINDRELFIKQIKKRLKQHY